MRKGFSLIELLAEIVILAIISVIVTPIILSIIDEIKKQAFLESVNGLIRDSNIESTKNDQEELLYKYKNGEWIENKLYTSGSISKYVEIKINKEGNIRYAITDGEYCATKEYDKETVIKK